MTPEYWNRYGEDKLPGLLGLRTLHVAQGQVGMRLTLLPQLLAPNGYLHAATVVALADTACGFGCWSHLADGAVGFTTIELKANFLATLREGVIETTAQAVHMGRNTHVWDAPVLDVASGKTLALFRCTQMVLWPN